MSCVDSVPSQPRRRCALRARRAARRAGDAAEQQLRPLTAVRVVAAQALRVAACGGGLGVHRAPRRAVASAAQRPAAHEEPPRAAVRLVTAGAAPGVRRAAAARGSETLGLVAAKAQLWPLSDELRPSAVAMLAVARGTLADGHRAVDERLLPRRVAADAIPGSAGPRGGGARRGRQQREREDGEPEGTRSAHLCSCVGCRAWRPSFDRYHAPRSGAIYRRRRVSLTRIVARRRGLGASASGRDTNTDEA